MLLLSSWVLIANLVLCLITVIALQVKRFEYPTNLYLLGAFTLFQSITLGVTSKLQTCFLYPALLWTNVTYFFSNQVSMYDLDIVINAFFLTTFIVIGLTLYTFTTKRDFSWLGGILSTFILLSSLFALGTVSLLIYY
jgi:FtsH-binding integral membrane protein